MVAGSSRSDADPTHMYHTFPPADFHRLELRKFRLVLFGELCLRLRSPDSHARTNTSWRSTPSHLSLPTRQLNPLQACVHKRAHTHTLSLSPLANSIQSKQEEMDPAQPQQATSLPWAIGQQQQQHPSTHHRAGAGPRRNSFFQKDKWALKSCVQCHEVSRRTRPAQSRIGPARVFSCVLPSLFSRSGAWNEHEKICGKCDALTYI